LGAPPHLPYTPAPPASFEAYYEAQLARSRAAGVRPGNEEKLLRVAATPTRLSILYVHGFGASRAEGEEVGDRLACELAANTYYLRLPGHGTNKEDHRAATHRDYLRTVEEALAAMPLLGQRVVVIGSSMGGLIATWLAATHPDRVAALVLASPYYASAQRLANVLFAIPGGSYLAELLKGPLRVSKTAPRDIEGWQSYWYTEQYYVALRHLAALLRLAARESIYRRVSCPTLLLYCPQEKTASVAAMLRAFDQMGASAKRKLAIPDGDHVLLSRWVRSDKETAERAIREFLAPLAAGTPGARPR
jgi:pimeloyl-ACP methyl ester carboxylesterase